MTAGGEPRREASVAVVVGLWALWLGWALTGPTLLAAINWDQGAYIAQMCAPRGHWSDPPWNAHFAIGHVYLLGVYAATALGGTIIDGFRGLDALAFALSAAFMTDAARRLSGDRWVGALCGMAWATAWVNLLFLFTLEDNPLYLPAASALFWLVVARREQWATRHSVWAGALAAWAALQSWQALYYLGPAGYAALLFTPGRTRDKLRAGCVVVGAFFATLVGWCAFIALTSHLHFGGLLRSMFSQPTGSFNLSEPSLAFWGRVVGYGSGWMFSHMFGGVPSTPVRIELFGWLVIGAFAGVLVVCTLLARRYRRWDLHLLALTLFLFTVVTPLYRDFAEWRYLIRFDFWPILLVLLLAALVGGLPRARLLFMPALAALIVWNAARGYDWSMEHRRSHATLKSWIPLPHPNEAFYGRDGKPWFQFFREVHEAAPNACRHLLAVGEVSEGWWNPDILGSMFSELRGPVFLIGDPASMGRSRYFTPPILTPELARKRGLVEGCAWISRDAAQLLRQ